MARLLVISYQDDKLKTTMNIYIIPNILVGRAGKAALGVHGIKAFQSHKYV
jgi:hypothetical protein